MHILNYFQSDFTEVCSSWYNKFMLVHVITCPKQVTSHYSNLPVPEWTSDDPLWVNSFTSIPIIWYHCYMLLLWLCRILLCLYFNVIICCLISRDGLVVLAAGMNPGISPVAHFVMGKSLLHDLSSWIFSTICLWLLPCLIDRDHFG